MTNTPSLLCVALMLLAGSAFAKPLITSSEETYARLCLDQGETADRLISACNEALGQPDLTERQRIELLDALGDALYWDDQIEAAAKVYREIIALDETAVAGWNGLGWALRDIDTDEEAFKVFGRSLELEPTASGLAGRAASGYYADQIEAEEARQMLAAAISIDENYAWAIRQIGWIYFDEGLSEEARVEFDKALALNHQDANALYGKARAYLSTGEPGAALDMLNQADAVKPMDYWVRVYRVDALLDLDRNAQALREGGRVVEDFPDKTTGYVQQAKALYRLQRRSEAISAFEEANEKFGPRNEILYWYADALAQEGRYDDAMSAIDQSLALEGADEHDHLLKSWIALESEDYAQAHASAERSIEIGGDDPWAHYYAAVTMIHTGSAKDGMERFDRAMEGGLPEDFVGYFAKELIRAGKWVEAAQLRLKY